MAIGTSIQIANLAWIEIFGNRILGMSKMVSEGLQRRVVESSEFQDDIDIWEFSTAKMGAILVQGFADPTDANGQEIIANACENGTIFTEGDIRLYISPTNYFTVQSPGTMGITVAKVFKTDRRGLALTDIGIAFSGGAMARMTAQPIVWEAGVVWQSGVAWDSDNFVPAI